MAQGRFGAQVSAWTRETKQRMLAVKNESIQRTVEIMQTPVSQGGNLPFKSGFLRASLVAGVGVVNHVTTSNPGGLSYSYDSSAISLVIAGAKISDPVEMRYAAVYSRVAEYGGANRQGRRFVALAAQQWPRIVDEVCREAQARAGS